MKFGLIHYRAPGDTLEQFLDFAAAYAKCLAWMRKNIKQ